MGFFSKADDKEIIKDLKSEIKELERTLVCLQEENVDENIRVQKIKTYYKEELNGVEAEFKRQISELNRTIKTYEHDFDVLLNNATVDAENKLADKFDKQDREYTSRLKKLESEYAEKIAKCDKKLEEDKISYRKYLRQENNTKIDKLEKANFYLIKDAADLRGSNNGLIVSNGALQGQLASMATIMEKIISSLPTVTAEITTPDITVAVPTQPRLDKKN